jgi:hypothetical protein
MILRQIPKTQKNQLLSVYYDGIESHYTDYLLSISYNYN